MSPSILKRIAAAGVPAVASLIFLAAPAAAPQAQTSEQPVLPGYWEYTTSAVGNRDTERKCVRASEINRFFGGLSTRRYRCEYPTRVVANGQARFEGNCVSTGRSRRQVRIRLNGTYQPESFEFRGGASIRAAGIWTPYIPATITARRISAQCPADAEYF